MQEIPDFDTDLVLGLFDSFDYQRPRKLLLTVSWSRACTCLSYCFCGISDIRQNGFRLLTSHVRQIRARRTLTTHTTSSDVTEDAVFVHPDTTKFILSVTLDTPKSSTFVTTIATNKHNNFKGYHFIQLIKLPLRWMIRRSQQGTPMNTRRWSCRLCCRLAP